MKIKKLVAPLMIAVALVTSINVTNANAMTKKDLKYHPIMTASELKDEINWVADDILDDIKHKRGEFVVDFGGYRHIPGNNNNDGKLHFTAYNLTNHDLKLHPVSLRFNNVIIPRSAYYVNWSRIRSNSVKQFTIVLKRGVVKKYFKKNYNKTKNLKLTFKTEDWFNKNRKLTDTFYEEYNNDIMDYDEYRVFNGVFKKIHSKLKYEFDHYVVDNG